MKIDGLLVFVAGAGLGSLATYFIVRKKFDELNAKEVEELKIMYGTKKEKEESSEYDFAEKIKPMMEKVETPAEIAKKAVNKREITDYSKIIKNENYVKKEEPEVNLDDDIEYYPVDFGEDNDVTYATYYSDGYLIDDDDHMIDTDLVGGRQAIKDAISEKEADIIQVRNNTYNMDYEIVVDESAYADVSGKELPDISEEE